MQIEIPQIIPIAALVAIVLFILREIFDLIKNKKGIARELKAAKYLISHEIERNYRSKHGVFQLAKHMNDSGLHEHVVFSIVKMESGKIGYRGKYKHDESFSSSGSFPEFHMSELNRWFPFIAKNEQRFLKESIEIHTCLLELIRFRSMMIDEFANSESLQSLSAYILQHENEMDSVFKKYYQSCTGKSEIPKFFK